MKRLIIGGMALVLAPVLAPVLALVVAGAPAIASATTHKHHHKMHHRDVARPVAPLRNDYGATALHRIPSLDPPECDSPNVVSVENCRISSNGRR